MSIAVMTRVWDCGPKDRSELLVLLALADFADDAGICWPAVETVAQKARMTERGVQKIVVRLVESGWLEVTVNGGRGGVNKYRVLTQNPERETPNPVHPEPGSPRTGVHKPRTGVQETPNGGSPEPSRTTIEPSITPCSPPSEEDPQSVLERFAFPESVTSFLSYRRKSKWKALTVTGATRLGKGLAQIQRKGGDPSDALAMAEERGWATVKPEWYFREVESNDPTSRSSAGTGAAMAQRAGDRAVARFLDSRSGPGSSPALRPAERSN